MNQANEIQGENSFNKQDGPGPLGQFKQNWSVAMLDRRFAQEEAQCKL